MTDQAGRRRREVALYRNRLAIACEERGMPSGELDSGALIRLSNVAVALHVHDAAHDRGEMGDVVVDLTNSMQSLRFWSGCDAHVEILVDDLRVCVTLIPDRSCQALVRMHGCPLAR